MLWGRVTYEMMESYWPAVARGDVEATKHIRAARISQPESHASRPILTDPAIAIPPKTSPNITRGIIELKEAFKTKVSGSWAGDSVIGLIYAPKTLILGGRSAALGAGNVPYYFHAFLLVIPNGAFDVRKSPNNGLGMLNRVFQTFEHGASVSASGVPLTVEAENYAGSHLSVHNGELPCLQPL